MKKIFATLILAAIPLCAQNRFPAINLYTGDPTGVSCSPANTLVQSTTTGGIYSCLAGVWGTSYGGGGGVWGTITGTLSNQTDLQTALNGKQASGNYLTALTGDCTATGPGSVSITCTKSNGTAFGTGAFVAAYVLPSTVVQTNQTNTYGAYLQDFSSAPQVKHPVAAGYASAANGEIGYDTTGLNWHGWVNGSDMLAAFIPKTGITNSHCVNFAVSGNTVTLNDAGGACTTGGSMVWPTIAGIPYWTSGTAWGGAYNSSTPIPANYLPAALSSSTSVNSTTIPASSTLATISGSPVSPNVACFSASTAIGPCTSANVQTAIGASVYDAYGAAAARQANLSLVAGTYADGKMCTYASSGTLLNCNTTIPTGTVTSVGWTGGIVSVATATSTPAFTIAGTSGGIPYFNSGTTWASSAALTHYGVVYGGGGAGAPVSTAADTTTTHALFATATAPAFRAIATTDIPTLNQNTTGTSGGVTGTEGTGNSLVLANATSGTITIQATTGALGAVTLTAPATTGTIALTSQLPAAQVAANLASSGSTGVTGQLPIAQVGSAGLSASNGVSIASTGAISLTYGTTANTVAQGNDSRITGAVQSGGALGTPSSGVITNLTGTCTSCTANSATTATNLSGTPALPNGTTATTQTLGDNSTKLATDAFVLANGSSYTLPAATSSTLGGVKPDGTTISNSSGAISCTTATTSQLGCVKPDGTTVTITGGVISSVGGGSVSGPTLIHTSNVAGSGSLTISSTTAGNTIAVVVDTNGATLTSLTVGAQSATKHGTCTHLGGANTEGNLVCLWYIPSATGGQTSITTSGGGSVFAMWEYEYAGTYTSSPIDTVGLCNGVLNCAASITPGQVNEAMVAGFSCLSGGSSSITGSPTAFSNITYPNGESGGQVIVNSLSAESATVTGCGDGSTSYSAVGAMWSIRGSIGGSGTVTTSGSPVSPNIAVFSSSTAITAATSANIQTAIGAGVYDASGAAAARQANLSLVAGTYADGKMCTYASSGTLLNCNTAIPAAQVAANLASSGSTGVTGQLPIAQVGSAGLSASNGVGIASTGAISLTYGTTANTVAQGNDSRITGAVQSGGALGTPSSGVITNLTGTCTSCTANSATSVPAANVASGALANGMTAITQSAGDNSTKLATTAYVATAVTYPVANTTFTTSTGSVGANTCNSAVQVAMTGVTTSMTFLITASADTSAATGWGSTGGLVLDVWPTAGYANYKICNQTAASITPTAVTFNIGAR